MKACFGRGWIVPLMACLLGLPIFQAELPILRANDTGPAAVAKDDAAPSKETTAPAKDDAAPASNTADEKIDVKPVDKGDKSASDKATGDKAASDKITAADLKSEEEYFELYKSLADTIDQVERNYVKPVSRRELMEAAIGGIITKLDPYSNYIKPEDITSFRTAVENQFGGIGIQFTIENGQIVVTTPLVGTPAYRAGVLPGDRVLKIDGQPATGLTRDDAVKRFKGDVGTTVTFTVEHPGDKKTETLTIRRELVHTETVMGDTRNPDDTWNFMLDPEKKIGYIRISSFGRDTATDLRKALEELQREKMKALILDLRFNPGGLLTSAVEVSDLFISEGRIVSVEGRNTPKRVWDAVKPGTFEGFPMAVLVNHYSASASEIVSACLQDHDRAVIVGDRTWGKGSVQNVIELEEGKSALKLTTATYTRPNGHNIHRFPDSKETDEWGVKPNDGMEVKLTDREMNNLTTDQRQREIAHGKPHAGQMAAASDGEKSADPKPGATGDEHPAAEAKPADEATAKHSTGEATSTPEKISAVAARPAAKMTDRQLQKAVEYLTSELSRNP